MQDLAGTKLRGRVLLPGNAISMTHMGQELLLCVEGADLSADAAHGFMVGKHTAVHVLLGSESMPQPAEPEPIEVSQPAYYRLQLAFCMHMHLFLMQRLLLRAPLSSLGYGYFSMPPQCISLCPPGMTSPCIHWDGTAQDVVMGHDLWPSLPVCAG